MKRIDIVLPVYNEEEGIAAFTKALSDALAPLEARYRFHLIYVLDRSKDRTLEILRGIAASRPNVTVLHLSRRFGHNMSLVAGLDRSTGDAVIMMDADLQHPPSLIPALLERFEAGYDVVHAMRRYDASGISLTKRTSSWLFYAVQNFLSPIEIPSGAADFRLVSRKVVDVFRRSIREHNQFLRGLFRWVGFNSTEVPFVSPPRTLGRTKYSVRRLLSFSVAGIVSFSKVPLRIATVLGFVISAVCLLYAVDIVFAYFRSGDFPRGFASVFVGLLFIGGLQLVVLGIIGEYLGAIFEEVKNRPLYVVDEVIGAIEPASAAGPS